MPLALRAATWSCMSEMSGETTMVNPPRTSAGSWKQMDFPPPVGRTARVSRPASTDCTTRRWAGRKSG